MRFFSTYRSFYKENLQLAFPVILSQIGQITVQMADTAMVGHYGGDDPTPLAAVSFATNLFYIIFITSLGLTFGLTPLVGERFAQKRDRHVRELLQNGLLLYSLIGVAATLLLVLLRGMFPIMASLMMGGDADASIGGVVDMAIPYYNTLIWSLFPVMIWGTIKQFLEGVGNTRVAMVTIIVANTVNILLNWVFIFGKCGFEPMGALGAGYATLISRILQCLMMVIYFFRAKRFRIYTEGLLKRSMIKFRRIAEILKVGIPISFHMFMEASAFVVAGIMVLAFGAASVSAYQIGVNMMNLTFMIVIAIGSSTTILCSHIYGNRDFSRLHRTVYAAYQMGLLWNISVATLFVAFRYQIPTLFTTNVQTIEITADMLIFISLFQVSDCLQAISISIMRGLQDVKVLMPIVFVSYVVINIPVAYLLAFECGFKTNGLIMGFIVGLSCCAVMTIRRVRKNIKRLEMSVEN